MPDYGKRYEDCTLDNFDPSECPNALAACRDLVADRIAGLLLYGTVGNGKTHLCVGVGKLYEREACNEVFTDERGYTKARAVHARTVEYWPVLTFARMLREAAGGNGPSPIYPCLNASLLILDDWGTERTTDFVLEALEDIVGERYRQMKPMMITSNYTPEQLAARYGDRALSRWTDHARIIEMTGRDRRPERGR